MTGPWVRDLLGCWHHAASLKADADHRWAVRCLSMSIDIDRSGYPGAGAAICPRCEDHVEREKNA